MLREQAFSDMPDTSGRSVGASWVMDEIMNHRLSVSMGISSDLKLSLKIILNDECEQKFQSTMTAGLY